MLGMAMMEYFVRCSKNKHCDVRVCVNSHPTAERTDGRSVIVGHCIMTPCLQPRRRARLFDLINSNTCCVDTQKGEKNPPPHNILLLF